MLKTPRTALLLTLSAVALAATGCGKTTIDNGDAEDLVKSALGQVENAGTVQSVKCPADQEAKKGSSFKCDVTTDAASGTATLTVGDVNDDKVNVNVTSLDLQPTK